MIEDLMKLKKQIETMIETYKDLHPDTYKDEDHQYELMDNGEYITKEEYKECDNIGSTIGISNMTDEEYNKYSQIHTAHKDDDARVRKINEDYEKEIALKRVREGYYENTFSKKQGKKTTESSKGSSSLCVYGDT